DQVAGSLGGHTAMIGEVAFLSIVGGCSRLNENDIALLQRVAYLLKSFIDVLNKDARAKWLVAKVEHDPIGVAILERNALGTRRLRAPNVFDRIAVRSDMIASDVEV